MDLKCNIFNLRQQLLLFMMTIRSLTFLYETFEMLALHDNKISTLRK